jgi:hypothetical protein
MNHKNRTIKTGLTRLEKSDILHCTFESRFIRKDKDDERNRKSQQQLVVVEQLEGGV